MSESWYPIEQLVRVSRVHESVNKTIAAVLKAPEMMSNGIELVVVQDEDQMWWVVNQLVSQDDLWVPIGPFENPNDAVVSMRMNSDYKDDEDTSS